MAWLTENLVSASAFMGNPAIPQLLLSVAARANQPPSWVHWCLPLLAGALVSSFPAAPAGTWQASVDLCEKTSAQAGERTLRHRAPRASLQQKFAGNEVAAEQKLE